MPNIHQKVIKYPKNPVRDWFKIQIRRKIHPANDDSTMAPLPMVEAGFLWGGVAPVGGIRYPGTFEQKQADDVGYHQK